MVKNKPLVTIAVISYNSEQTIEETLNSIFEQDYSNLELIISDDASRDNTAEIAHQWIDKHSGRFSRIEFIQNTINEGVSKNLNRACDLAKGIWIKPIAADDILVSNAISTYMENAMNNPNNRFFVAFVLKFKGNEENRIIYDSTKTNNYEKKFCSMQDNLPIVLFHDPLIAPTFFIKQDLLREIGGFDEKFRNIEDWPFLIKVCYRKEPIYCIEQVTVLYRFSESASHSKQELFFNINHLNAVNEIKNELSKNIAKNIGIKEFGFVNFLYKFREFIVIYVFQNKNSNIARVIYSAIGKIIPKRFRL